MEKNYAAADPRISAYVAETFAPEDGILQFARRNAEARGLPSIQVAPADALHLEVLSRALRPRKCVEIGTLGGYSGIALARGLAPGGVLHTFELDPAHSEAARAAFDRAGLTGQVKLHLGAALEMLPTIEAEGPFDLVFIDADKVNYPAYLDWAARHLRPGGVVLGDNAFVWGGIADPEDQSPEALAMRAFNREAAAGGRFRSTLLPTGEGLLMAVKL